MDIKPGYKTSEGWGAAIIAVISLLLTAGVISQEDGNAALALVPAMVTIITIISYIVSRTMVKNAAAGNYTILGQMIGNLEETPDIEEIE